VRPGCSQWSVVVVQGVMAYKLNIGIEHRNIGISVLTWKNVFTVRVMKHWNRLPREVVEGSFLDILEVRLDQALSNLMEL